MDPTIPQYDSYAPMDEHHLQNLSHHRSEGTHHLEVEDYERRRHEAPVFLAISRMHQDKRSDLEQEIKDLESRYDRAKKDEQTLIGQRESLRALQSERPNPSEWTVNERNFVLQMSRMRPSLVEKIATATADRKRIADESIEKNDALAALNKRFHQAQYQPQSVDGGKSLGRTEFFNNKRTVQEILWDIAQMLNNYHAVRFDKCLDIIVEGIGAFEEEYRITPDAKNRRELRHFENLHRELLRLKQRHIQIDGTPFVTRFTLIHKMAEALATEPLRLELQNRVYNDNRHGIKDLKASLQSNSFKPSPVALAEKEKKKPTSDGKDGKGQKRKSDGKGKKEGEGNSGEKKGSKKKDGDCSLCGLDIGHTDAFCWTTHDNDAAKAKIALNRAKPEMAKFFKNLDAAAAKRKNPN